MNFDPLKALWRVGRKRPRNVYAIVPSSPTSDDDVDVGRFETAELAQHVVDLHNETILRRRSS